MKKLITSILSASLIVVMLFSGCGLFGGNNGDTEPKEYTIRYTDDSGAHTITVTDGMPYSLEAVPAKTGYDFIGLYDSEEGGTQYVAANGSSLAPFSDKKNIVLFPQYKAKEYTVILDYQGAPVTGSRQLTAAYGSSLPELPKNLTLDHKEFAGWYTQTECGGTQIADKYGLIPLVSVVNEQNFDLSGSITLYAGFGQVKHTVTLRFEMGMEPEEMQVPYDTPISQVVPKTRVNGNAVLTWSKTRDGEVFNGKVTEDMNLYAIEYAPVIEFDVNGGKEVTPLVARAGSAIALPAPTKDLAKFAYWEDMNGNKFEETTMPAQSTALKAVWQAKLVFNENGGSDVDDISVAAGEKISLPVPERESYIFAGWYTADKEQYTSTTMPAAGIALKAGWYKEQTDTVIKIASNKSDYDTRYNSPSVDSLTYRIECNKYLGDKESIRVKIDWHVQVKAHKSYEYSAFSAYVNFYSQKLISNSYFLEKKEIENVTNAWRAATFTTTFEVSDDIYAVWYTNRDASSWWNSDKYWYISDFYYTIHYPDTTNLYL